jgi:glutathione S-transferase
MLHKLRNPDSTVNGDRCRAHPIGVTTGSRSTGARSSRISDPPAACAIRGQRNPEFDHRRPVSRYCFLHSEAITIVGAEGSPYSRKLRAVLRYRRIPHHWVTRGSPESQGLPRAKVELLPQLLLPEADGRIEAHVDSTPLIRELETRNKGRRVVPTDPVVAYLDALLEDYADEWLTKAMFHYRWAYPPDIAKAAAILPRWFKTDAPEADSRAAGELFSKRQIDRLWVVGSNPTTGPVIEESYERLLALLDAHLTSSRFVMGSRPGAADFALYGQLTQLVGFDPTSAAIALAAAPRVVAWVDLVDDLSGVEPGEAGWFSRAEVPATLRALFAEIGRVYVPFLLGNAEALAKGSERVECTVAGRPWLQRPFPYQGKCLTWLREGREALSRDDLAAVDAFLEGSGCEELFG